MRSIGVATLAGLLAATPAFAETPEPPAEHLPPTLTSDAVRDAPPADRARGTTAEASPPAPTAGRSVSRAMLWLPRGIFLAVAYPLRAALYLEERYRIVHRLRELFINEAGTLGVYPVALEQTGFGLSVGGRLFWRSATDHTQALRLRASYGGRFSQLYTLVASSGNRFEALRVTAYGVLTWRNRELFYGIGNGDVGPPPAAPIPLVPGAEVVETRFREMLGAGRAELQVAFGRGWSGVLSGGFDHYTFSTEEVDLRGAENIGDVYQLDTVPGFESGVDLASGTLELRYDSRRPGPLLPPAAVAQGGLASVFGGYSVGPDSDWRFARYGAEAQLVIDLNAYTRTLTLRALVDGVIGDYDEIPMVSLPHLGGGIRLRGYPVNRFRDRVAALASAEYGWQVSGPLYAFLFVDAGRVASAIDELSPVDGRVGFGGGLHLYSESSTLVRVQLSSGLDGGLFAQLVLDDIFDPMWRRERR